MMDHAMKESSGCDEDIHVVNVIELNFVSNPGKDFGMNDNVGRGMPSVEPLEVYKCQ